MPEITPEAIEDIKELVLDTLKRLGVVGSANASLSEYRGREVVSINISTDDSSLLIGRAGESLVALQHVTRMLFRNKGDNEGIFFVVDVNNYKKDKETKLQSLARSVALSVRRTKRQEMLRPMASYDRWVIHNYLADAEDLVTESSGQDPERYVVVRLASSK